MGFSRQGYWSGFPFPSSGDLPDPGIEPRSPVLQEDALPSEPPGKPIKKAECQRIDAFELWCWRRLLRVPWTARSSNLSILQEISPEYSLEGRLLKLKLQYFETWCEELTHWKRPWCWERLKVGGEGDNRGWDGWMVSPTQWTWVRVSSGRWWCTGRPGMLQSMGSQRVAHDWATELNWKSIDQVSKYLTSLPSSG